MGIYRLFGFAIRKYLFVGFKILLYKSFRIANPKERRSERRKIRKKEAIIHKKTAI